jgi:hypothetical protein
MSNAITYDAWTLMHKDGTPACMGEMLETQSGEQYRITGGRPPHKPASTGRVWIEGGGEFFPSVFGLKWVETNPKRALVTLSQIRVERELDMACVLQNQMGVALLDMIQLAYDATQYNDENETKDTDLARIQTAQAVLKVYQRQSQK